MTWGGVAETERIGSTRLERWSGPGGTTLRVRTTPHSSIGWVVVGAYTSRAELRQVVSVENRDITVAALAYYHDPDEIVLALDAAVLDMAWFGARGDGSDSTAAFQLARDAVKASIRDNPEYIGADTFNAEVFIPAGDYLITEAGALMDDGFTTRSVGIRWVGAGYGATQIIYEPTVAGPLFYNNDAIYNFGFEGIEFHGNDATSTLLYSNSAGGAKSAKFIHCEFSGDWLYGVHLVGTNTNSELSFDNCKWTGSWTAFLYTPATGASNQSLNYWFNEPIYWSPDSPLVTMNVGGHIKVVNGDFSGFDPTAETYLFNLGSSATAGDGVQSLDIFGCRFELKNDDAKFLYCEWDIGAVTLVGCDFSSQRTARTDTAPMAKFVNVNNMGPLIGFYNSQLIGVIEFHYNSASYNYPQRILFENCEFTESATFDAAFSFTAVSAHTNKGGIPVIRLRNCRCRDAENMATDADINWQFNTVATTTRKIVSLKNADGKLPFAGDTTVDAYLPLNAVILDIRLYVPAGDVTEGDAATFTVQTTEGSPTELFTVTIANFSAGIDTNTAQFTVLDTAEKAHIQLIADANVAQPSDLGYCLVEYIG